MVSTWHEYNLKVREINLYFSFLQSQKDVADKEIFKVLKSNTFLMIYNLMESTVRNSLEEIHNSINAESLSFDDCIDEVKALWIEFNYKKFKENSSRQITHALKNIGSDIFNVDYFKYIKKYRAGDISGNLDKRKIEELAGKYNFSKNTRIGGSRLFIVRNARNSLAHGEVSFSETGRKYELDELILIKKEVVLYLKEMLLLIEKYIKQKEFSSI